jgi:hypothetical protein
VNDATAARGGAGRLTADPIVGRRRILQLALVLPATATVLGGCSGVTDRRADRPDPLIALADAARADAALAAAAVAADPALAARIDPLREARTEHAAAFDAEVLRMGGAPRTAAPPAASAGATPPTAAAAPPVTLARVREAVEASQVGAAELVENLPAERVGLVASVAACCATYAAVLA